MKTQTIKSTLNVMLCACGLVAAANAKSYTEVLHLDAALDRPVVPANQAEDVVVQIKVHPHHFQSERERPPVNLSLVLDRSGSMSGEKIEQVIQAAEVAVGQLGVRDRVSVVIYDDHIDTLAPSQLANSRNVAEIRRKLRQVTARGNTAIYAGLNQAAAELRRYREAGYINRMILLSDGLANHGPSKVADFRALGQALAGEDIVISTVGLGLGFNEDIMTTLARAGQGNTYFVENADELPRIFAGELGDVLNVAATDIEIIVRPRGDARILRSVGRKAEIEDDTARFRLPQVYSGMDKLALLEIRVPEGHEGAVEDLVEVEVKYLPAGDTRVRTQHVSVPIRYSAEMEKVVAAARRDVAKNVVDNRVAEAKEEAVAYSDAGDRDEAASRLRGAASRIASDYAFMGDEVVAAPTAVMLEEAKQVEREGLSNAKRKSYRSDSYQRMNQQSVK